MDGCSITADMWLDFCPNLKTLVLITGVLENCTLFRSCLDETFSMCQDGTLAKRLERGTFGTTPLTELLLGILWRAHERLDLFGG